jgi:hypothetical protein
MLKPLSGPTSVRKVLFGTPCYDGKVHVEFLQSLLGTLALCQQHDIAMYPVQIAHDALVQRARNDLVRMALETGCDDLIFMDADQEWEPQAIIRLLNHPVDVVGFPVIKKSDTHIDFNIKLLPEGLSAPVCNLLQVESIGTGCLRLSKNALQQVWGISKVYGGGRMVFDVQIVNGEILSEDTVFCSKWSSLGGQVWVDPSMTCPHLGSKKYIGNFANFIQSAPDAITA